MGHTPGPWVVRSPNGRPSVWTDYGCKIASVEAPDVVSAMAHGKRLSNARLISAAPELITALRRLVAHAEAITCYIEVVDDIDDQAAINRFLIAIDLAKETVAKAEGK